MIRFLQTKITVHFQENSMEVEAYVSESGATRLFMEEQIPVFLSGALGSRVDVTFGELTFSAVLLMETLGNGNFLGLKFLNNSGELKEKLKQEIEAKGEAPPWVRQHPRIPVTESDIEMPVPNLGVIRSLGKEHFVNVQNFSPKGVRLENFGDSLAHLRVGSEIVFDLITNRGDLLKNFRGVVKNISASTMETDLGGMGVRRAFGVKFSSVPEETERRYRDLIRDYCVDFKKRFE